MWTGVYLSGRGNFFFFNSYVSRSPVRRTAQSALHVMLLSYYIGFMSVNATFAIAARTRKVSRRPCTCLTTIKMFILHRPLHTYISDSLGRLAAASQHIGNDRG